MKSKWQGICLSAVVLVSFVTLCHAQVTPEDEYKKLIKVDQDIQPLGANPFGENINLYDGTLSFEQTDVSLSGNGPTITFSRSLSTANPLPTALNPNRPLGDWELEIPRIETMVGGRFTNPTWQVPAANPLARCTSFGPPPIEQATQPGAAPWGPSEYWYGYHLIVPGTGSQELLNRDTLHNPLTPTQSGQIFPIITKQNWMIHCGVTADDGGEGFVALAPDGTEYTFTHLIYRPAPNITKDLNQVGSMAAALAIGPQPQVAPFSILDRRDALMLVTQVKDRFGNTLSYNYDSQGRLSGISASDGRSLTLQYVSSSSPLISTASVSSASAGTRTWSYNYDTTTNSNLPTLTGVALPDGSAWSFQLNAFQTSPVDGGGDSNCSAGIIGVIGGGAAVGTIIHPSGLVGTFTNHPVMHGRAYVPKQCFGGEGSVAAEVYSVIPSVSYQQSIASKVFSGAGMPTETWTYGYSPANQSWATDACAGAGTCPTTVWTDVTDPQGHDVRSTFSNHYDVTEGQLLRTDYYSAGNTSAILRSEVNLYANPVGGPWPVAYGIDPQSRDNRVKVQELAPLQQRTITEEGGTYTWLAEGFNAYAQVTQTKRSNSISPSYLEETTTYLNDTSLWVLGLPLQVTNITNTPSEIESTNTYDPGNDTLLTRARFGQFLMHYTFNSGGQLASFTDGNSHTTSLSNYKRGIPQTISYPDSTSEALVVDDFGQIGKITDQAGHATSYSYDPIGRITGIT